MRPDSSAIGMKSAGASSPRSGWVQRTSASNPTTDTVASDTTGW